MYSSFKSQFLWAILPALFFRSTGELFAGFVFTAENRPATPKATAEVSPVYVNVFDLNNNDKWDMTDNTAADAQPNLANLTSASAELTYVKEYEGTTGNCTVTGGAKIRLWEYDGVNQKYKILFDSFPVSLGPPRQFYIEGLENTAGAEDIIVEVTWSQQITVDGMSENPHASDTAKTGVWEVDMDVDSDNSGSIDGTPEEDWIEASTVPANPRKILLRNPDDGGIMDGTTFKLLPISESSRLIPIQITLKEPFTVDATCSIDYSASVPRPDVGGGIKEAAGPVYTLNKGGLRLWKTAARNPLNIDLNIDPEEIKKDGDFIPPNTPFAFSALGAGRTVTLYAEYVDLPIPEAVGIKPILITATEGSALTYDQVKVCLLPVEIRDVKDWDDPNDDVLIEPKKDAKDTNINSVAWIEPHKKKLDENPAAYDGGDDPRMPQLEVQFKGLPASVKVQWKFRCKYARPSGRELPEDEVKFPADGSFKEVAGDQPWKIHQEYNTLPFFGGDVELTYKIVGDGGSIILAEKTDKFRIAGQNPADDRCRKYIDKIAGDLQSQTTTLMWYAYAIAKSETKAEGGEPYYNQFLAKGQKGAGKSNWADGKGKEGIPNWNNDGKFGKGDKDQQENSLQGVVKPGGYGIKQVTGWQGDDNGNVPRAVIWDWKTNVNEGLHELMNKHNDSREWMAKQRAAANKALASLTVNGVVFTEGSARTMDDAVAMKHYNGSSRRNLKLYGADPDPEPEPQKFFYTGEAPNSGYFCYWDRPRNKWSLSRYNSWGPPFNYVQRVCEEVDHP